ncbi:hypothetical protein DFA_07596 [Cavenderia fasciculata]|uniref:Arylamine N-acetyltransferase n=1 Tax=Cavenderia fasciculata TaxID=261658 RepID=F4Q632_CACFS|nr:uncharacterized protein DFA_07596 [Cavenderia fasciculata]EGG16618.1 hypothetical protein DFA_07596 [Cavenderia fasciculata]|eukprot:XP_004355092.1 hypothetical protein DFA_07596 [Cavenderia fasciculata]
MIKYLDFKRLMFNRIGFNGIGKITFDHLPEILESFSNKVPYNNFHFFENHIKGTARNDLIDKILIQGTGGLSYQLNGLMFYFLKESGFDVNLISCRLKILKQWTKESIHLSLILNDRGKRYMVEVGTGSLLPQKPVLLVENHKDCNSSVIENQIGVKFRFHGNNNLFGHQYLLESKKPESEKWEPLLSTDMLYRKDIAGAIRESHEYSLDMDLTIIFI